jgi:hypothetical protein
MRRMRGYVEDGNEKGGDKHCGGILLVNIIDAGTNQLERCVLVVKRCLHIGWRLGGWTEVSEMH